MTNKTKLNVLRGLTTIAHLDNNEKTEILKFITELELSLGACSRMAEYMEAQIKSCPYYYDAVLQMEVCEDCRNWKYYHQERAVSCWKKVFRKEV